VRDRRFAWWLVWAYPPRFRRDVGLGLVDAIDDRMRARRAAGASRAAVRVAAVADTIRNAPAEWLHALVDAIERSRHPREPLRGERTMIDRIRQDVKYALRLWIRRPAFAFVAIITLALGIGANTAMFSIVNAVLLRPLPYANGDRIVMLWGRTPSTPQALISWDEYVEGQQQSASFEAVALWLSQSVNWTGTPEPQRIIGNFVSGSFFDVLALKAERGRLFTEADSAPGTAKSIVVISRSFWEQRLGSDPDVLGKVITLNGLPLTVVGVLAPPFDVKEVPADGYFVGYDAFIPIGLFPVPGGIQKAGPGVLGVARLGRGVTLATANANLEVVSRRLEAQNPSAYKGRSVYAMFVHETIVGTSRTPLLLLLGAVAVVLLIACVNVSNLLVARAIGRQKEMAVRSALGASRSAVLRQLAVEAALLAVVSTAVGLLLGSWALTALATLRPAGVPIPDVIPLDGTVLAFTAGVSVLVAIVCGLAPAAKIFHPALSQVLQVGGRRSSGTHRATRDSLVAVEIALAVALLAVSGLLIQSLLALQNVPVGFDPQRVFTLQFRLPATKYARPADIARFFEQAIERVRSVPGVESAALVRRVPFSGNFGDTPFTVEGRAVAPGSEPRAAQNIVTPDYFRTMRVPLAQGRDFTERDDLASPPVVVVNQTLARTTWPGEDPIGKHIKVPDFKDALTVIGVVGDMKQRSSAEPSQPQLYLAHYQLPMIFTSLVARTSVPPLSVTADVRKAVWSVDKDQPMWAVVALDTLVEQSHGSTRFLAMLLAMFAGVALVLAAVGVYGVMSYAVSEQTHEIGIRMALGASDRRVLAEVVGRGARLTAAAVVVGLAGAVAAGRLTSNVLFGIAPTDPMALVSAAALLGFVSLAACYIPARRASRVDPVVALAQE
jgi:predicted permease